MYLINYISYQNILESINFELCIYLVLLALLFYNYPIPSHKYLYPALKQNDNKFRLIKSYNQVSL